MKGYSVDYSLTITLRPKCYIQEPEQQYDATYEYILRILRSLTEHLSLVAEVTKSFNIHYHSILQLPLGDGNCLKKIYKAFRNDPIVGFIKCDQTVDKATWIGYLKKDIIHTYNSINRRPIIYDHYDIFDVDDRADFGITW